MKKNYPWVVVGLLFFVALLNYLDRQMLSTMRESMSLSFEELQGADGARMFGWLMSAFLWVYALVSPFAGAIADKLNRKWLIIGSLAVWSAVTCLMGYSQNFSQLLVLRGLMGISEALYIPSALSLIADWHKDGNRSLAIGMHTTGLYLGSALGGYGALVASEMSWQFTFHTLGYVGIAYAFVLVLLLKEKRVTEPVAAPKEPTATPTKKEATMAGVSAVLSIGAFWVILFMFAIPSLPGWATKNWLPELFSESLGMDITVGGPYATIALAMSSFAGAFIGGVISDKWVKRNVRGRVFTSAIGLGLTLPGLVLLGFCHGLAAVVGAVILFGLGFGIFDTNNMPILCQFVASKYRATGYGIMNMVGVLFGAVATAVMGSLPSLALGFACMAGAVAIAICLQLTCLHPKVDNKE